MAKQWNESSCGGSCGRDDAHLYWCCQFTGCMAQSTAYTSHARHRSIVNTLHAGTCTVLLEVVQKMCRHGDLLWDKWDVATGRDFFKIIFSLLRGCVYKSSIESSQGYA